MIEVRRGELSTAEVEALVRPISSDGQAVTVAGRKMEVSAGDELAERVHELGQLPVGGAVITPGGNLFADFVIHVVVQSADEPATPSGVQRGLVNALRRAKEWGLESLALPPIGTGAGSLDAEEAADILVGVLSDHMLDNEEPRRISVVVENEYEEDVYLRLVAAAQRTDGA